MSVRSLFGSACMLFTLDPTPPGPRPPDLLDTGAHVLTRARRLAPCAGALVFFMQAGFAMLEAGIVQPKNATNILFKNMIDASLAAFIFWAIGYGIAYGKCWSLLSGCLALCIASQILLGVGRT